MSLEEVNRMINNTVNTTLINSSHNPNEKFSEVTDCPHCGQKSFGPVHVDKGLGFCKLILQSTQGFVGWEGRVFWKLCTNCGCCMSFLEQLTKV